MLWIILALIVIYLVYSIINNGTPKTRAVTIEEIEDRVHKIKKWLFELEPLFDDPSFIDYQNFYETMEVNYLRIKQRVIHVPGKPLEFALDWLRYVGALHDLRNARVMLDVSSSSTAWEDAEEDTKEPSIIKEEVERKFEKILEKDWLKLPPNYFERQKRMKEPSKEIKKKMGFKIWQYYYEGEKNLDRMLKLRRNEKESLEN